MMTPQEAQQKLDALVEAKVKPYRDALTEARREKVAWYQAGYIAGTKDDPSAKDHLDRPIPLEQRAFRASAQHALEQNK